jgi:rRNA pseudouridine-1189 N-methylase Emg1 (Nep1/Mra1 family)
MSPSGEDAPLEAVFRRAGSGTVAVLIGAFPEGDYTSPAYELAEVKVSLGPRLMRVPEVTSMVLRAAEEKER